MVPKDEYGDLPNPGAKIYQFRPRAECLDQLDKLSVADHVRSARTSKTGRHMSRIFLGTFFAVSSFFGVQSLDSDFNSQPDVPETPAAPPVPTTFDNTMLIECQRQAFDVYESSNHPDSYLLIQEGYDCQEKFGDPNRQSDDFDKHGLLGN